MRAIPVTIVVASRAAFGALAVLLVGAAAAEVRIESFPVPRGAHPHDVAPAPDGTVWYTAQHQGALGRLDPATGAIEQVPLGEGSRPHGVIVGPDGLAWVTDSGLNAMVSVHPKTLEVTRYPLPEEAGYANLNTATFGAGAKLHSMPTIARSIIPCAWALRGRPSYSGPSEG